MSLEFGPGECLLAVMGMAYAVWFTFTNDITIPLFSLTVFILTFVYRWVRSVWG